jgi:glycosyltransferase involved in cell wall biosynthesis
MKKHILFIVENNPVPFDVRVWNEALAAKEFGNDVSIICPKTKKAPLFHEKINGISIYRHFSPIEAASKYSFLFEYANALFWELLYSLFIFIIKPFQLIHSANPPDHIFIIATIFKLFKVKFVFDHHDISPENYIAKFGRKDLFFKVLKIMENLSFKTANIVISTNQSYRALAIERGKKKKDEVFVVRNGPNLSNIKIAKPNAKWLNGCEYMVAYVGVIGNQEGIDVLLRTVAYIVYKKNIQNIRFIVIGTGPHWKNMVKLSKDLKVDKNVLFTGFISYGDLYEILATADLCVNPEFRNPFTDKSTMIKIMEYMVFGKPIVQFETTEGKFTAGESAINIKNNSETEFAEEILKVLKDEGKRKKMGQIGKKRIKEKLHWDIQKKNLKKAYEYLDNCY